MEQDNRWNIVPVVWNEKTINWNSFSLCIVRYKSQSESVNVFTLQYTLLWITKHLLLLQNRNVKCSQFFIISSTNTFNSFQIQNAFIQSIHTTRKMTDSQTIYWFVHSSEDRSPWDYTNKYEEFLEWISKMESMNIRVLNDTKTMKWNVHKRYLSSGFLNQHVLRYLKDLEKEGISVVPTEILPQGSTFTQLDSIIRRKGWEYSGWFHFEVRNSKVTRNTNLLLILSIQVVT